MSQLEMVFMMKVSLHLKTMKDVVEFEKINKKCSTTIHSLKVNPWFKNIEDIEKFYKIFEPTTCNCNGVKIDNSILLKAERIRNYLCEGISEKRSHWLFHKETKRLNENEKHNLEIIIPKVESIKTNTDGNEEEIELLIQNMKPNVKINCNEDFFINFENAFRKLQVSLNFYPKQIIINMNKKDVSKVFNLFQESNQNNIICIWRTNNFDSKAKDLIISSNVKSYFTFIDLEIMEKNKNVVLMLNNIRIERIKKYELTISLEDILDKEKRKKYFDFIDKSYAQTIIVDDREETLLKPLFDEEIIKLPECVKEIVDYFLKYPINYDQSHLFKLPFSLEGIEVLKQSGIFEINEKNDLKELELHGIKEMNFIEPVFEYESGELESEFENTIDYFPKLTKLVLFQCKYIDFSRKIENLEYLSLYKCDSCNIDIDSKKLKIVYLNFHTNSEIKLKICRNDIKFIIYFCSNVNIRIECEEGIKPNIEIKNCIKLTIKSNNEMGNIIIEKSYNISFNDGFKCELIQLTNLETTNRFKCRLIEAKVVKLFNVLKKCPIDLNKANEIVIECTKNYVLEGTLESCKKLVLSECINCKFDLGNNQIEEMKVMKCKSTNIEGTIPNIKSFVSIENSECKLPITTNIITTDEEIIELKGNMKIVTDKKHLIIRNGKDVICEIESLIKCDITFENCHNIDLKLKNGFIGILEFNNCESFIKKTSFPLHSLHIGSVDSLIVNNSKNMIFNSRNIDKSIKVKESEIILYSVDILNVYYIEIENSNVQLKKDLSSNTCIIINSSTDLSKLVNNCKKELVLKKIERECCCEIDWQVKKITFEDCSKLNCEGNLKGKEVKLIRCFDMKLKDTSNSIQMESCQNIEVDTQIQQKESQSSE